VRGSLALANPRVSSVATGIARTLAGQKPGCAEWVEDRIYEYFFNNVGKRCYICLGRFISTFRSRPTAHLGFKSDGSLKPAHHHAREDNYHAMA
jgi:hypothetical protein